MTAKERKSHLRIGVVEDDVLTCGMLSETLERFGHIPFIYNEGWPFLEDLVGKHETNELEPFDLILLDILLPGTVSGIEVLNYLSITKPKLPVVVLSALGSDDLANIKEQYPDVKILQKPFHLSALRALIEA